MSKPPSRVPQEPLTAARILIIDANTGNACSLARLLELKGHRVLTAANGLEAVTRADRFRPQIIFVDLAMPRMKESDAIQSLRALPGAPLSTIVALTSGTKLLKRRSDSDGVDLCIPKPVTPENLDKILSMAFGGTLLPAMFAVHKFFKKKM